MNEIQQVMIGGWPAKVMRPTEPGPHPVLLLIHGWTGDENSMWVFAGQLPPRGLVVAPRAPHPTNNPGYGGYSWIRRAEGQGWPAWDDFTPAVAGLEGWLASLAQEYPDGDYSKIDIAGFSEGAALAGCFAIARPGRVRRLAMLAGFLPAGAADQASGLSNMAVFIAHGSLDDRVPVSMARDACEVFEAGGAATTYCESEVGHKLGSNCLRGFKEFFESE